MQRRPVKFVLDADWTYGIPLNLTFKEAAARFEVGEYGVWLSASAQGKSRFSVKPDELQIATAIGSPAITAEVVISWPGESVTIVVRAGAVLPAGVVPTMLVDGHSVRAGGECTIRSAPEL